MRLIQGNFDYVTPGKTQLTLLESKIWVESPLPKTYSDPKEEPYFLVP